MYLDAQNALSEIPDVLNYSSLQHVFPMVNNKAENNEWKMISV